MLCNPSASALRRRSQVPGGSSGLGAHSPLERAPGLTAVGEWKPDQVEVYLDSKLVVEQVSGRYKVKSAALAPLHARAQRLLAELPKVSVKHVARDKNKGADALANRAIDEWKGDPAKPQSTRK